MVGAKKVEVGITTCSKTDGAMVINGSKIMRIGGILYVKAFAVPGSLLEVMAVKRVRVRVRVKVRARTP